MRTRSWRTGWGMLGILLLWAQVAIAAPALQELEERVLQAIARHADREAAMALVEAWQQQAPGAVSPRSVALNEGLNGHYLTAKHLMKRVTAEKPDDKTLRLGSLVLVLLEGNPPTCRQAIEELFATYPENPQLEQRYADVLESMGLPATKPPPRDEEPAVEPTEDPAPAPTPAPAPAPSTAPAPAPSTAPAPAAREIRPVQAESVREQLLRQLAESQERQTREEEARQKRAKDEQTRKRREEATRLAAERMRRSEAARQLVEQAHQKELARQAAEKQARLAHEKSQRESRRAAERVLADKRKAAEAARRKTEQQQAAEKARLEAEQKRRLEQAEQARWLSARNRPSAPPARPPEPAIARTPSVPATYVLKPQKIADRRVWIGEERASVHARLGRPRSAEGPGVERYAGLCVWYDPRGKVSTFELDSAWYAGPGGVRPGLTLREVLRSLPNSDGLFHLRATGPEATSSLYVLSTLDGTLAELRFNDEVWLSTMVRTTTPAGATHLYEELLQKGPVRRLTPDYVFALEARRKPLP